MGPRQYELQYRERNAADFLNWRVWFRIESNQDMLDALKFVQPDEHDPRIWRIVAIEEIVRSVDIVTPTEMKK